MMLYPTPIAPGQSEQRQNSCDERSVPRTDKASRPCKMDSDSIRHRRMTAWSKRASSGLQQPINEGQGCRREGQPVIESCESWRSWPRREAARSWIRWPLSRTRLRTSLSTTFIGDSATSSIRPCNGLLSMNTLLTLLTDEKSQKTQCDGSRPCRRCARLKIPCLRDRPYRPRGRPRKFHGSPARRTSAPSPTEEADSQVGAGTGTETGPGVPGAVVVTASHRWQADENLVWTVSDAPAGQSEQSSEYTIEINEPILVDAQAGIDRDIGEQQDRENESDHADDGDGAGHDTPYTNDDLESVSNTSSRLQRPASTELVAAWPITDHHSASTCTQTALDHDTAQALLRLMLSDAEKLGIFEILNHPQLRVALDMYGLVDTGPYSQELSLALLAIAIELEPSCLPSFLHDGRDILIDTLRVEFLTRVPTMARKTSDLSLSQCVSLVLASYTISKSGKVYPELTTRCESIGHIHPLPGPILIMSSVGRAIHLQAVLLQTVLNSPRDIDSTDGIRDSLEQFFLDFPPNMLEFSSIKFVYQLEAMIWFHEYAILLGEVSRVCRTPIIFLPDDLTTDFPNTSATRPKPTKAFPSNSLLYQLFIIDHSFSSVAVPLLHRSRHIKHGSSLYPDSYQILQASLVEIARYRWSVDGCGISRVAGIVGDRILRIQLSDEEVSKDYAHPMPDSVSAVSI
ncbi:hypothetical protein EDB81DRAFT_910441 [Dactylonectria macrodidyma]|uniref:Zn(2)-C6 fungal-type domain-containing protein n=1 Tax=Dactylonectria macrodidyma TaxID=307937 RepID=A0A9P9DUU5_9HYPO|nr:hypothetical protein EDB81DRAFT_910441 [Dactylonectria macrodidyma]